MPMITTAFGQTFPLAVAASAVIQLTNGSDSTVASVIVQIKVNSGSQSIVPKGRISGSALTSADFQALAYKPMKTGTVTDPTVTAITASGLYEIQVDGCDLFLDTTVTSGSVTIYPVVVAG